MHLHLPRDHATLPWIALFGMNLLNLNYWGANQVILQRALAAQDLRQAQLGLVVGGVLKYVMALIVVVPGIALVGILNGRALDDPDQAYLVLVGAVLPVALPTLARHGWRRPRDRFFEASSRSVAWFGISLFASLVACHVLFH